MHRLLIVDNEPNIVKGLYELFEQAEELELDIYCAYSANEALGWMSRIRIDILLTDIRMPGMSGLELHKHVTDQWPRCKVIFLTGYNEFEFAQTAIRQGGFNFLLKTEDDEEVIHAVKLAVQSIEREMEQESLIEQSRQYKREALPLLRQEYCVQLLEGDKLRSLRQWFTEYEIALSPDDQVLVVTGRVDRWYEEMTTHDRSLLYYAIRNISEEHLSICKLEFVVYDSNCFVLLIQPKEDHPAFWKRTVTFVHGVLDSIQESCKQLLNLSASFAVAKEPCDWQGLSGQFYKLRELLRRGMGLEHGLLINDAFAGDQNFAQYRDKDRNAAFRHKIRQLNVLTDSLEGNEEDRFFAHYDRTMEDVSPAEAGRSGLLELYYGIAGILLRYIHYVDTEDKAGSQLIMNLDDHDSWEQAAAHLREIARRIFAARTKEQAERTHYVISMIHKSIEDHLDGDLSLARLNRAKELLSDPQVRIQDVAKKVGLYSASYFSRFFKREMNCTPQEFRNRQLK